MMISDEMDGCDFLPLKCKKALPIFTGRNEVVAKVIFLHLSVIHSVHRGGLPQCMLGYPPRIRHHHPPSDTTPDQTPPGSDTPPGPGRPPRIRHHPPPPDQADSSIRSTSGRYASYWNAFLLHGGLLFLFTQ